ncbi:M16 family metallopeptidase [Pararhodonellum marinum]|uniref:M16 family metallopeptidase n=1 Tax=Pararhodonellum marinum TaxID=2755358 RepID=UPI0018906040|nr:pitrilysin family protein [Pararhodonellum marinum]
MKKLIYRCTGFIWFLGLLSVAQVAEAQQNQLPDPVKVTTVEGITEYVLDNGLRVLLFPDQTKQTITVNITYLVGSKHENYGETGMAHLLEHLVFKGTPRHPDIPKELTERGARPNGTTWTDRTNYFETFTASEDNLRWALDLESDRMVNSFIAQKDLDSEMTVVRNEFESGENNPWRVLWQRMMATAFEWHNYGKSTIGARSDIENVPIERLQAFYRMYYQPDNAVLVVAGKIDEEKTIQMVNEFFGPIPRPERELPKFYTRDPDQDGERTVTVRRVGDTQWVGAGYKTAAASHADAAPIEVLSEVMGSSPSGRLYKALIDTKKATSTFTYNFQWKDPGIFLAFAELPKDKILDEARISMLETFDDVITNPITEAEVERAKNTLIKQIELSFNSSENIGLQLSEYIGAGDWRLLFIMRDRIKEVNQADVQRVAETYLKPDNRTIGMFKPVEKPDRTKIPGEVDIAALVEGYTGGESIALGEEFDPTPSNIDSRTEKYELANGMKVALLPKKTRGESVNFMATLRFGNEDNLKNQGKAGNFAASMLNKGTKTKTREQIKDELDKLKANVNIFGGASSVSVYAMTTRENLPQVMNLLKEMLRESIFPQEEFDKAIAENITGIESQMSEPTSIAYNKLSKYLNPYPKEDPRYAETFEENLASLKALKLEEVKRFHADFYGADQGTMGMVGDFDAEEMKPIIKDLFEDWNSPAAYTRLAGKIKQVPALNENIETPDKANAFFLAQQQIELSDAHPDYPALVLGNFMLGGGFLNSRLATRIRQKEGLSYGVGSGFYAGSIDPIGTFQGYAIYAPENVEKLEAAFKEEIEKVLKEGFTEEEITAAKSGWLQSRSVNRAQDNYLASTLNGNLFLDRNIQWEQELEDKVAALTAAQIHEAMKKHLKLENMSMVKAGDFAKENED